MADGPTLYPPAVLEHAADPCCAGTLDHPTHSARADNPVCGDRIELQLEVKDGHLERVAHTTRGCALCMSSASMLASHVAGSETQQALRDAETAIRDVEAMRSDPKYTPTVVSDAFAGVARAPARVRCVTLPWEALRKALEDPPEGTPSD